MATLTAVDPGDRWTGVAFFDPADNEWGWECTGAVELGQDEFIDSLAESIMDNEVPILVFERWRLYADHSEEKKGSEFETSQLIGAMKFVVRRHNEHCFIHTKALNKGMLTTCELRGGSCMDKDIGWQPTLMVGQMADIKKPTAGILKGKGIKSITKAIARREYEGRDHIVDAELHGWHYILNGQKSGSKVYYGE